MKKTISLGLKKKGMFFENEEDVLWEVEELGNQTPPCPNPPTCTTISGKGIFEREL